MAEDVFNGLGIEVELEGNDSFLRIKEALSGIGVALKNEKKLIQSCHVLHKRGRYAIVHFKEMFIMDGKESTFSEKDKARRNRIALLLRDWGLFKIMDEEKVKEPMTSMRYIKVLSYKERKEYTIESKYSFRTKKSD